MPETIPTRLVTYARRLDRINAWRQANPTKKTVRYEVLSDALAYRIAGYVIQWSKEVRSA